VAADFAIRPATLADVPALGAIETRAGERYRGLVPDEIPSDNVPEATLLDAASAGRLFVAEAADRTLAGFALVVLLADGSAHLEELDVLPECGRRGIGTALVEAACRWAKANGRRKLTLTTFRDVPFNAPYYLRLGFRIVVPHEITPALAAVLESEHSKRIDLAPRVCLQRDL
jgi:GNAT superfamily N-acetyltransferase